MKTPKAALTTAALLTAGVAALSPALVPAGAATAAAAAGSPVAAAHVRTQPIAWHPAGHDIKSGISGLAVTSRRAGATETLIVRDNKRPGENRVARLDLRPERGGKAPAVQPLAWRGGAEPVDLEALEPVPGTTDEFLALASRGLVHHVRLSADGRAVEVLDVSPLPAIGQGDDFESFALLSQHGRLAAVWADRGAGDDRPATLYAAPVEFGEYGESEFGAVTKTSYRAPYPTGNVRHASDIALTRSGRLLIAAAADEGDDGPFASAVLDAGRMSVDEEGRVRLSVTRTPSVLRKFEDRKVEAVDCVLRDGSAVVGTDDENAGGAAAVLPRLCR